MMSAVRIIKRMMLITCLCISIVPGSGQKTKSLENTTYFPIGTYKNLDKIDSMGFIWRSELLLNFGEQKLYRTNNDSVIIRFTWQRSFDPPMIFLFINSKNKTTLQVKTGDLGDLRIKSPYNYGNLKKRDLEKFRQYLRGELDSISVADIFAIKGFYTPDNMKFKYATEVVNLTDLDYLNFKTILMSSKFWVTTTTLGSQAYHDGAGWMIEGYTKENGYHVVKRHSPSVVDSDKGIREVGEYLIHLYGKIEKEKIY